MPLKGEITPRKQPPDLPISQISDAPTPNTSIQTPDQTPAPAPGIRRSTRNTERPNNQLIHSGVATKPADQVLVTQEIVTEPDNYTEAMA